MVYKRRFRSGSCSPTQALKNTHKSDMYTYSSPWMSLSNLCRSHHPYSVYEQSLSNDCRNQTIHGRILIHTLILTARRVYRKKPLFFLLSEGMFQLKHMKIYVWGIINYINGIINKNTKCILNFFPHIISYKLLLLLFFKLFYLISQGICK